jgi:hypothetical protein
LLENQEFLQWQMKKNQRRNLMATTKTVVQDDNPEAKSIW